MTKFANPFILRKKRRKKNLGRPHFFAVLLSSQGHTQLSLARSISKLMASTSRHQRKTRGLSMCNKDWPLDADKRIRVEFNDEGQPIGDHAATFATSIRVLARMGKYCDITKADWREISEPMKGILMDYLKERFIFSEEKKAYKTCERVLLQSMGHKWRTKKCKLRDIIREDVALGFSETEIYVRVPQGVEKAQWKDFVDLLIEGNDRKIEKSKTVQETTNRNTHRW